VTPDIDPVETLLENMSEGVCMVDAQGRIVLANRRLAELLDLSVDLLRPGCSLDSLMDLLNSRGDYGSDQEFRQMQARRREAVARPLRYERIRPNGLVLDVRCDPIAGGGFVIILSDVTEQREAAEILRRGEARFRDFAEVASDFQWETDERLQITSLSDSYAQTPARESGDILGRPLWEVPGIDDVDGAHWQAFRAAMKARQPISDFRYSIANQAGRRLYRRLNGRPVHDSAGRFTGYRFATRDETAEVEADRRARAAEELLRRALESIPEGIAVYDPADRLVLMNRRYVAVSPPPAGYDPAEDAWLRPGISFEEVIRIGVDRGNYPDALGHEAAFIHDRVSAHREGQGRALIVRNIAGRAAQVRDHRLPDGSTVVVRTDISELVDREETLKSYQARLDLALRAARAAYWELDLANGTHQIMPNYAAMLGYGEADAPRGRAAWLALVHPDDAPRIDSWQQVPPGDESDHRYEFRIRAADGSWRWLLSCFRALTFDAEGRATRLLGIDTDITRQKESELALQAERDRAQRYLDIAGVIMLVLDVEQRIQRINRKGCEILGVTEAQVLGLNWFDNFAPESERAQQKALYDRFVAGKLGPSNSVDMRTINRRGETRTVHWRDILLRDEQARITGCLSSGQDVTEQHLAERRHDELRTLMEATAQASPDGIVVTDTDGRYLFWNHRLQRMWQLSDEYLQAQRAAGGSAIERLRPYTDLIEDPHDFLTEIRRVYAEHRDPGRKFAEVRLKDGRVLEQFAASVSAGDPPITAIAWIYRDITEAKRRDEGLARSQRLAAVGELSGGMAHELNNLLMVISGHLELIQVQAGEDSKIAALAETASTAVRNGAELIHHVLAFARQQPLAPLPTDVNGLVDETMRLLPRLLGERIRLDFRAGEGLWSCTIDASQLQTALVNLALNARDAMPEGGHLAIRTANRHLRRQEAEQFGDVQAGDYVLIEMRDDGCGMPPEVADRAFEPFFTTKPVGRGTGLGLSMVFGFVKQSGGHVAIDSHVGAGTLIRIYLPRAQPAQMIAPSPLEAAASDRAQTVLVVEDEPGVSAVAQAFLTSLGYGVLDAPDGPRALEILKTGTPIDILFTDVVLPEGMNGKQIAEAARALRPGIKILFASGYAQDALTSQGKLDATATLLQKPYRRMDLMQALRRL
jgi:PAS domain S-box-containing protein